MEYLKFYPLVDCDSDGTEKMPMFFSLDEQDVAKRHRFYLGEIVPNHYRLYTGTAKALDLPLAFSVRCPSCGKPMKAIGRMVTDHALSLYTCTNCTDTTF